MEMAELKLWRIWQTENGGYDTYDSAVVVAETEDAARQINPDGEWARPGRYSAWAPESSYVSAMLVGIAVDGFKEGDIICSSFNAG